MSQPPSAAPAGRVLNPDDMMQWLLPIWRAVLEKPTLGVDDDFFLAGGDSTASVALFRQMEERIGPMPPVSSLVDHRTVRRMAARIDELRSSLGPEPVVVMRATGNRAPLVLCHAAMGNILFVRQLLPYLDEQQPFLVIRGRGLEESETPHNNMEAMAADYIRELKRIRPEGPYIIAGNCAGGYTAYEMARQMWSADEEVLGVVLIDPDIHPNTAPWLYWRNPLTWQVLCWRFFLRLWWATKRRLRLLRRRLAGRRPWGQWPYELGLNLQRQLAVLKGFVEALRQYRPKPVDRDIHLLCSSRSRIHFERQRYGWTKLAPHVEFVEVGREHEDMFYDDLPVLAAALNDVLERLSGGGAGERGTKSHGDSPSGRS